MRVKNRLLLIILGLFVLFPIHSKSLDSVISEAKQNSPTIRLITLNKANSDLSIAQSELKERFGISVSSGDITYKENTFKVLGSPDYDKSTIFMSPSVLMSFPTKEATSLKFSIPSFYWTLAESDNFFNANPTLTFSRAFKFGDSGDNLDDLKITKQRIELERGYQQRILDFESSIYSKIIEILNYETTLLNNEKEIFIQQTKVDNARTLKTVAIESTTFKSMELELERLLNTKDANQKKLAMALAQYKQLTALEWNGIEDIREAELTFRSLPNGDSTVLTASLDLEIAKETLALKERASVKSGTSFSVPSLNLTASSSINYSKSLGNENVSYDLGVGASYSAKNFTTAAGIGLGIGNNGDVKPTITVSGSWSNNPTALSDALTIQGLENSVTIASIDYQQALLDYQIKANQLESDLLNFGLDVDRFIQNIELRHQLLEQIKQAFEKGLAKQTDVDQALLDVELIKYEQKIYALQALILENRIKSLQL